MPYIGNTPAEKYAAFNVQNFTTSATTSYTLDRAVANELDIRLVINNVIQQPGAGKAYTASGTTLTLSGATTGTDTMYAVYIGKAVQTVTPGANSVGPTALQDNSVTNAKLADATQGDVIYYAAAGAPAQLSAGTSGHFLKTQGAGANPTWAAVAAGVSLSGSTNNTVATVTGANALAGETNFIYNGTIVGCGADGANADQGTGIHVKTGDNGGTANSSADQLILENADAINSGSTGMTFLSSGNQRICFGDAADNDIGRIMYNQGSNYMNFKTNAVERLRINDSGRFGFGTAAGSIAHPFHFLYDQGGDAVMAVENSNNSNPQGIDLQFTAANPNNTSQYAIHFGATAGTKFIVYSNGNVVNANNSYGSTSDNRLKENITDANSQWNDVKKLKFKNFNLINDSTSQLGVIAQDLENDGMSGLVDESPATKQAIAINSVFGTLYEDGDELPEGKNIGDVKTNLEDVKSVKYSVLLLKSVKALQEAITKIETLEAKVTALENA